MAGKVIKFPSERTLPIIYPDDRTKIDEMFVHIKQLVNNCQISYEPVPYFCCGKRTRRTDCYFCFRSLFGSTKQMGLILARTFEGTRLTIPTEDPKSELDCMFFTATCEPLQTKGKEQLAKYKSAPTFILCNPNAMFYQYMVNQPHAYYLRFFLNKDINVLVWNYRGYGLSSGSPTPTNIKQDGESILRYMRTEMELKGKVGVYGRSLGGVVTTHLIDQVDFVFADRTFGNFSVLSNRKFYTPISRHLFNYGSGGWELDNDIPALTKGDKPTPHSAHCHKVIMTEKADEVVEVHSSLMVGVARAAMGRKDFLVAGEGGFYLSKEQLDGFLASIKFIVNLEHDLYVLLDYSN